LKDRIAKLLIKAAMYCVEHPGKIMEIVREILHEKKDK